MLKNNYFNVILLVFILSVFSFGVFARSTECFVAGTQISMIDGIQKNIEQITVGDAVLSVELNSLTIVHSNVSALESDYHFGIDDDFLVDILFSDGTISRNTNNHPYYVIGKGWASYRPDVELNKYGVGNEKLISGDLVYKLNGYSLIPIRVVSITELREPFLTYDLVAVTPNNNFFANGILVHNSGGSSSGSSSSGSSSSGSSSSSSSSPSNSGSGGSCFPAGTLISTPNGEKLIESIEVGDVVYSFNFQSDLVETSTVLELESPLREGYYVINNGVLRVTDEHPLFVQKANGKRTWAAINPLHTIEDSEFKFPFEQLELGDSLVTIHNDLVKINSIVYTKKATQTYNLKTVSKNNNFYANGFLVHNKGRQDPPPTADELAAAYAAANGGTCTNCPGCTVCDVEIDGDNDYTTTTFDQDEISDKYLAADDDLECCYDDTAIERDWSFDPETGELVVKANVPTYDPSDLPDGYTQDDVSYNSETGNYEITVENEVPGDPLKVDFLTPGTEQGDPKDLGDFSIDDTYKSAEDCVLSGGCDLYDDKTGEKLETTMMELVDGEFSECPSSGCTGDTRVVGLGEPPEPVGLGDGDEGGCNAESGNCGYSLYETDPTVEVDTVEFPTTVTESSTETIGDGGTDDSEVYNPSTVTTNKPVVEPEDDTTLTSCDPHCGGTDDVLCTTECGTTYKVSSYTQCTKTFNTNPELYPSWYGDACCAGVGECRVCSGTKGCDGTCSKITTGTPKPELCNGVDDDCDGIIDEGLIKKGSLNSLQKGVCAGSKKTCYLPAHVDPNLNVAWVDDYNIPNYEETETTCDGLDNDCDGAIDEGCDSDLDGFIDSTKSCSGSPKCTDNDGFIVPCRYNLGDNGPACENGLGTDCDDNRFLVNPGMKEICDTLDNDCDAGQPGWSLSAFDLNLNTGIDEGCDDDHDGQADGLMGCQGSFLDSDGIERNCKAYRRGKWVPMLDCDDWNADVVNRYVDQELNRVCEDGLWVDLS